MPDAGLNDIINVEGEVIEIYEKEGKSFAKIQCCPGFIEICIDKLNELHLSDKVLLELKLSIGKIETHFDKK